MGHRARICKVGPTRAVLPEVSMSFIGIDVDKAQLAFACLPSGETDQVSWRRAFAALSGT
jgi:hypothetical protein